jgi:hypothetical protein
MTSVGSATSVTAGGSVAAGGTVDAGVSVAAGAQALARRVRVIRIETITQLLFFFIFYSFNQFF